MNTSTNSGKHFLRGTQNCARILVIKPYTVLVELVLLKGLDGLIRFSGLARLLVVNMLLSILVISSVIFANPVHTSRVASISFGITQANTSGSSPDFTVVAEPYSVTVQNRSAAGVNLTITSINGFHGSVTLGTDPFPGRGLEVFFDRSDPHVSLVSGGKATAKLLINAYQSRFNGIFQIWVDASSSCLHHMVPVTVVQPPLPDASDFTIAVSPDMVSLEPRTSSTATVSITSINGFAGLVRIVPIAPYVEMNSENVTLSAGSTAVSQLTFFVPGGPCEYRGLDILIIASGGQNSHATLIALKIMENPPTQSQSPSATLQDLILQLMARNMLSLAAVLVSAFAGLAVAAFFLARRPKHG